MKTLVDVNGNVRFGLYDREVDSVNYMDCRLETPMKKKVPELLKKIKFNQFHFIGIIGPELMVGMAVVDLKYITNGFFYIYERESKYLIETKKLSPPNSNIFIDPFPEEVHSCFKTKSLNIEIKNHRIQAKGKNISVDVELDQEQINPLRLCSRAGYGGWLYTQKTTPIALSGKIILNNKEFNISSPDYMALTDWTAGYMRRHTFWNWASTACVLPDGRSFGLNLSCGVNETSFTENAFWLNGKMTKINLVNFIFDNNDPAKKWHISSTDKKINLIFYPESHRGENINVLALKSRFIQLLGIFEGTVVTDDGEAIELSACPGWTEDHYAKW